MDDHRVKTEALDIQLDAILKGYAQAKNVKSAHGNTYYDFTFKEAKAALRALLRRENIQARITLLEALLHWRGSPQLNPWVLIEQELQALRKEQHDATD